MELELTKEQSWISESVDTLLSREWVAPADIVNASAERRCRTWTALVEFGEIRTQRADESLYRSRRIADRADTRKLIEGDNQAIDFGPHRL